MMFVWPVAARSTAGIRDDDVAAPGDREFGRNVYRFAVQTPATMSRSTAI